MGQPTTADAQRGHVKQQVHECYAADVATAAISECLSITAGATATKIDDRFPSENLSSSTVHMPAIDDERPRMERIENNK